MGNCTSSEEDRDARQRSLAIDKGIRQESDVMNTVKLLLLGAGESGKSTFLKQFKLIHGSGYSAEERLAYRPMVLGNVVNAIQSIVDAMETLQIPYENSEIKNQIGTVKELPKTFGEGDVINESTVALIQTLWTDKGIQQCFQRSNEYQLLDSASYFLSDLARICAPQYEPTVSDMLRVRVMTTTITETKFKIDNVIFRIFDVGGQRSERRKWASYFDDSNSIIFVAAISAYDQTCFEDNKTNRVLESLTLFDSICNHPLLCKTSIILFLNKMDLFKEKVSRLPIKKYFPEYKGSDNYKEAAEFFAKKFLEINKFHEKKIYVHFTFATDTTQVKTVFATVTSIILRANLMRSGF
ncbi:guanine nucleotide-binding protein alpha-1 subunit [Polychytrium aggregatum]|uniref:guanine nucleotide-binding protein alpha-1 subunit n=1 Tax=Polychytrium aggregatum TaxID=110093 RepID=UPI0022FE1362|nr:guanine nucleotide-binding protein alpha-1 subunit [Polychytrium aggregatum]KAI9199265.1 guanine nucleotide-binding protein alpha-1 subunit [Polychytrium aggregatum]